MDAGVILAADETTIKIGVVFGLLMAMMGAAFASKMAIEVYSRRQKLLGKSGASLVIALGLVFFGFKVANTEYDFMMNYLYVEGKTLGIEKCGKSNGVLFEYTYAGKRYTNCASYVNDGSVTSQGGRYWVRIRKGDPSLGRMDFGRPVAD